MWRNVESLGGGGDYDGPCYGGVSARKEYLLCPAKQRFVSLFVTELKKVASLSQCISIGKRAVYRRFQSAFQNIRFTGYIRD